MGLKAKLRQWGLLCGIVAAVPVFAQPKLAVFTVDDLPLSTSAAKVSGNDAKKINDRLVSAFRRNGIRATGFVNDDRILVDGQVDERIDILWNWLRNGMELGNHNYGHVGLFGHSVAENQEAVIKGETVSKWLASEHGSPYRFYRHPYTQTGNSEEERADFEAFLAKRGYTVAPFTIEYDDYLYSCVYDKVTSRKVRATVEQEYLEHMAESVRVFEKMSQELFGRQIPQIFLIHDNQLNANTIDRQIEYLKRSGYGFTGLDEALKDPAYSKPTFASKKFGPSWLTRWAKADKQKLSVYGQPDPGGETAALAAKLCQ